MKKLRIHYFQHVPHEGLGSIEEWALSSGHTLTSTKLFESQLFPKHSDYDWLIIMGGPMNADEENKYPWLADEKKCIKGAVDAGKTVLGICLGSQLVSSALGAKVFRNKDQEIGWFEVKLTPAAKEGNLFYDIDDGFKTFHWHGDTFDLPEKAILLASSAATKNQAYIYDDKVLALQFHLEPTINTLLEMLDGGIGETGKYIQTEQHILNEKHLIEQNRKILFKILDRLAEKSKV